MTHAPTPSPRSSVALPRSVVLLVGAAAAVITAAGVQSARGILGPLFLALVLAIVVHPLRLWLERRMPGWLASTLCILSVYLLVVGIAAAIVVAIARFATLLPAYEDDFVATVEDATRWLHDLGVHPDDVQRLVDSFDLARLAGVVGSTLSGVAGLASSLVFLLALCLFLTVDGRSFPAQLHTARADRPSLVGALGHFASGTRRYLLVSTVFGLVVAILDTIALYLMDVPVPLLWGLLAFLTNYIPNIGFVIGLVPPALLALLDSGPGLMLAVIAVYCVLNLIIQSGIQPKVVGDAVGLSTTLTFVSLVFWSWIIGPVGAIMAVPLTLLVKALLVDADDETRWLRPLIANKADDPVASPAPD
ncbi:AI-2E family transporter [Aeromicrobium massiliense]|uniref:AI-2E family transporter n=1 Tax=Aeromicrobium massiliense TaxID=1464554 RepID=UPI0002FF7B25|nr:AI-2E family transporter [Aeromicrobium massiliense]